MDKTMAQAKKRVVVMGGSFNPPTRAHYILMKEAIDAIGADEGLFVPVSDAYLRRKMKKSRRPVVLSPDERVKMLRSMCGERMAVCEKEIGTIEPRTVPTLMELQSENPDAELYFLMGADKLDLLALLARKHDFLKKFNVVLFSRDNVGVEEAIKNHPFLAADLQHIVNLPQPSGTDTISSSRVRSRMLAGVSSEEMLCPGVWDLFRGYTAADFPEMIYRFKGENAFLSNRFGCLLTWEGVTYGSAEAAFQSSKRSGDMESIVRAKFRQNPKLMEQLMQTGEAVIINGNNRKETFWGVDLYSWRGENNLGKILMKIREENEIYS